VSSEDQPQFGLFFRECFEYVITAAGEVIEDSSLVRRMKSGFLASQLLA
jgi:hypothetical protein